MWRWDNTEPFGDSVPNDDPNGTGSHFNFSLCFPGQFRDEETGLCYNYHRYYDASIGSYTQFDPFGLRAGINGYAYVGSDPLRRIDSYGLFGEWPDPSGPPPMPLEALGPPDLYWGWEAYAVYGRGRTSFTCTDEHCKRHTYIYKKYCIGAGAGISVGGGVVAGANGAKCKPGTYAGWFLEGGVSAGVGVGLDVGFNSDGPTVPSALRPAFGGATNLPGTLSNVIEGGVSVSAGTSAKLLWCYYVFIKEE